MDATALGNRLRGDSKLTIMHRSSFLTRAISAGSVFLEAPA